MADKRMMADWRGVSPGFSLVVSTAVFERRQVLLVQQGRGRDHRRWNLPGGKVEPGESLLDAAVREAWEETGCEVRLRALAGVYQYVNRTGRSCVRFVFLGEHLRGVPRGDGREILAARWFELDHALALPEPALCKPAVLRPILADLRRPAHHPLELLRALAAPPALAVAG